MMVAAPSDLRERPRLEVSIRLRHLGWVPLDRDRVVQVRSECIKSTPSDRDPVPLIAYRFAARWSNLDRSDLIQRPISKVTPSRVSFAHAPLCFSYIEPAILIYCSLSLEIYYTRAPGFSGY